MMPDTLMKKSALTYARKGFAVAPLKYATKNVFLTPYGFNDATSDPEQVNRWWDSYPDANIAIATGQKSGGLLSQDTSDKCLLGERLTEELYALIGHVRFCEGLLRLKPLYVDIYNVRREVETKSTRRDWMAKEGWVSIHRQVQDHWLWKDKPFSKNAAWIDLLLTVNHADNKLLFDGELMTVERGSMVTSIHKLSERWGWGKKKVSNFLDLLEKDEMLSQKRTDRYTTLTIEKYGVYQGGEVTKEPVKNQSGTSEEPVRNLNNNVYKENKLYIAHFDAFWTAYPRKLGKKAAQDSFRRLKVDDAILACMLKALDAQKQSKQWSDKQFIPYPATWLNQRRWEDDIETDSTNIRCSLNNDGSIDI